MIIQTLANKVLSLDPEIAALLIPLSGKTFAVHCSDFPGYTLYGEISGERILFNSATPTHIDTTINCSLNSLVKFVMHKGTAGIQITGDIMLAQTLMQVMERLDINWEDELSKYTGDPIAHQAATIARSCRDYGKDSTNTLAQMITEYLQEESRLLPTRYEVEAFMHDVDELRLAVDRLEAKMQTLTLKRLNILS